MCILHLCLRNPQDLLSIMRLAFWAICFWLVWLGMRNESRMSTISLVFPSASHFFCSLGSIISNYLIVINLIRSVVVQKALSRTLTVFTSLLSLPWHLFRKLISTGRSVYLKRWTQRFACEIATATGHLAAERKPTRRLKSFTQTASV